MILGIWTVGDTDAAFYNVVDVNILAEPELPGGWSAVGSITPSATLLVGDKVKARAFTATGESAAYSVEVTIDNAEEGQPQNWAFKLAESINQSQTLDSSGYRATARALLRRSKAITTCLLRRQRCDSL